MSATGTGSGVYNTWTQEDKCYSNPENSMGSSWLNKRVFQWEEWKYTQGWPKTFLKILLWVASLWLPYSLSVWKVGTSKLNSKIYSSHEALCMWKIMSIWRIRSSRFYSKCRKIDKEKQNLFSRTFLATVSWLVEQMDI